MTHNASQQRLHSLRQIFSMLTAVAILAPDFFPWICAFSIGCTLYVETGDTRAISAIRAIRAIDPSLPE